MYWRAIRNNLFIIIALAIAMAGACLICVDMAFAEEDEVQAAEDEKIVLEVYEDDVLKESFTRAQLEAIWQSEGGECYDYSAINTNPSFEPVYGGGGPTVEGILHVAGIDLENINDRQTIEVKGADNAGMKFLKSQIFSKRYYFPNGSVEAKREGQAPLPSSWDAKEPVPAIVTIEAEDENEKGRLVFGQISPNEQTRPASINQVVPTINPNPGKIVVHTEDAESLNAIQTTDYGENGAALKGDSITFDRSVNPEPSGFTDRYTIYFTTDGTEPDPASPTSQIYNYNNVNFGESDEKINKPIVPDEGDITIRTKVVRYGKVDSAVTEFSFYGVDAPVTVAGLKTAVASYQALKLNWSAVNDVNGYEVSRYVNNTIGYKTIKTIDSESVLTFTNTGLLTGTAYYYKVRAYKIIDGKTFYGGWSAIGKGIPYLGKTAIAKITAKKKALTLTWTKVAGASGYQIYRSTKKTGSYKLVKTIGKQGIVSWKNSKLKKKKTYWYKVRAYRVVSGKKVYGSFSTVKYKKTK